MTDVMPQRNLPGDAEAWGREIERRLLDIQKRTSALTGEVKAVRTVTVGSAEALDENLARALDEIDSKNEEVADLTDHLAEELKQAQEVLRDLDDDLYGAREELETAKSDLDARLAENEEAIKKAEEALADVEATVGGGYTISDRDPVSGDAENRKPGAVWEVRDGGLSLRRFVLNPDGAWSQVKIGPDFVGDNAIGNAQIGNLNAAKITAGTINTARLDAQSVAAAVGVFIDAMMTNLTVTGVANMKVAVADALYSKLAVVEKLQATEGIVTKDMIATGAVSAEKIAARAVTASKLTISPGNLWPDPFFLDAGAWTNTGVSVVEDPDIPGGSALKIESSATQRGAYYQGGNFRGVQLTPGGKYRFKAKVKKTGTDANGLAVYVQGDNDSGGLAIVSKELVNWDTPAKMYDVEVEVTVPGDLVGPATVGIYTLPNYQSGTSYIIGNISLVEKAGGSLIVDGGVSATKFELGQNARWTEDGLIFYAPVVGGQQWNNWSTREPVVSLTPAGDTSVAVAHEGNVTAGMRADGHVFGNSASFNTLSIGGKSIDELILGMPRGIQATSVLSTNTNITNTERDGLVASVVVHPGRRYKVEFQGGITPKGDVRVRVVSSSSVQGAKELSLQWNRTKLEQTMYFNTMFSASDVGVTDEPVTVKITTKLFVDTSDTGTILWSGSSTNLAIYDIGSDISANVQTIAPGVNPVQNYSGSVSYVQGWGWQGFTQDGRPDKEPRATVGGRIYGSDMNEYINVGVGNMMSTLSGATVTGAVLYIRAADVSQNSKGVYWNVGMHSGYGSIGSIPAVTTIYGGVHLNRGETKAIPIPGGHLDKLRTGGFRSVWVSPTYPNDNRSYGYLDVTGTKVSFNYKK